REKERVKRKEHTRERRRGGLWRTLRSEGVAGGDSRVVTKPHCVQAQILLTLVSEGQNGSVGRPRVITAYTNTHTHTHTHTEKYKQNKSYYLRLPVYCYCSE